MKDTIRQAIYEKYITPTKRSRPDCIGVEIEMPVVNLAQLPVEEDIPRAAAAVFAEQFGFVPESYDAEQNVSAYRHSENGDILSFDCSYSNLELSFGKAEGLFEIRDRFAEYVRFLNKELAKSGYMLTGMGINPHADINHNLPIPNERYRMLYHFLHSYPQHIPEVSMRFHERPDFGTFTSASQVQLDVSYDQLTDVINTFGLLEPYKALLFANSYLPQYPDLLCARNMLWEHSMQGYNPHNIGMFDKPLSGVEELLDYIGTQSIYCTMRDGKYVDFTPTPVGAYFTRDQVEGEYFDGQSYQKITFVPEPSDLEYLRTFKFEDLTFRGTIEYRSACCQPFSDAMTVAAFHTGLKEQLRPLSELLSADTVIYSHGYSASELQKLFSCRELPDFIDPDALRAQLRRILDLAAEGLRSRGQGEESLLTPLYDRAERLTNPAKEMLTGISRGESLRHYIEQYAAI